MNALSMQIDLSNVTVRKHEITAFMNYLLKKIMLCVYVLKTKET